MRGDTLSALVVSLPSVLVALIFPSTSVPAAEVMVGVEGSPSFLEVRIDRLTLADGSTQQTAPQRLHGMTLLPGNVVGFELSVQTQAEERVRYYRFACPPDPSARSLIAVHADAMPLGQSFSGMGWGVFTGQMGACVKTAQGRWHPLWGTR